MRPFIRTLVVAALCSWSGPFLRAQAPSDPSGHWEGSIQIPGTAFSIEVDLTRNKAGQLAGTFGNAKHKGFPLATVALEGQSIRFHARIDQPFEGVLSVDGQSIAGSARLEGFSLPFRLTRTGDARIEAPTRSAPIGKELEGSWSGALDVNGKSLRFLLTMTNQPDGGATASIVSLDEGELEIPITVAQQASNLTLDLDLVGGSYSGAVDAAGTELVGTFTQGTFAAPLNFRRAAATEGRR